MNDEPDIRSQSHFWFARGRDVWVCVQCGATEPRQDIAPDMDGCEGKSKWVILPEGLGWWVTPSRLADEVTDWQLECERWRDRHIRRTLEHEERIKKLKALADSWDTLWNQAVPTARAGAIRECTYELRKLIQEIRTY